MSEARASRPRPLSPHLTAYRWPITMTMSILNRLTGGALYFGMALVAWWLLAAATSESAFGFVNGLLTSWFGLLVLLGFTWAMIAHTLGGMRHLMWDTGVGMEKANSSWFAWATLIASIALTVLLWAAFLVLRG